MKKFVVGLLLMVIIVDVFCPSEAWWWRRRRRRPPPCGTKVKQYGWENDFDGHLKFKCPAGKAIRYVRSMYSPCARDRAFIFGCSSNRFTKKMRRCNWSKHWNNDWDNAFFFTCPNHGVMAGIESIHANNAEDRRYKFYCCHSYWHRARLCKTSGYVNNWRSDFKFRVKRKNWFIVGAYSFHKKSKEDRRFKFQYCKVY